MTEIPKGMIYCPNCDGTGTVEVDTPITDWVNGHDIMTDWWTCEVCLGERIVEDEDYDEDVDE